MQRTTSQTKKLFLLLLSTCAIYTTTNSMRFFPKIKFDKDRIKEGKKFFEESDLSEKILSHLDMSFINFKHANLSGADLNSSNLLNNRHRDCVDTNQ